MNSGLKVNVRDLTHEYYRSLVAEQRWRTRLQTTTLTRAQQGFKYWNEYRSKTLSGIVFT